MTDRPATDQPIGQQADMRGRREVTLPIKMNINKADEAAGGVVGTDSLFT